LCDLPPELSGVIAVPDSVEIFSFNLNPQRSIERVVLFGRDSMLNTMEITSDRSGLRCRSLLCVSSRSLKILRRNCEFEGGVEGPPERRHGFGLIWPEIVRRLKLG
jgi:hypothetical protein